MIHKILYCSLPVALHGNYGDIQGGGGGNTPEQFTGPLDLE